MTKRKKNLLERVRVPQPCDASWDEITEQRDAVSAQRLCEHCEREVHDLSQMTKAEAEDLIGNSKGKVCVRLVKDADGRTVTKDSNTKSSEKQVRIIGRSRFRFAASAVSAALILSNAAGQTANQPLVGKVRVGTDPAQEVTKSNQGKGVLVGTVYDAADAVVAEAEVYLTDIKSGAMRVTQTDDYGNYNFEATANKKYKLEIESPGFDRFIVPAR